MCNRISLMSKEINEKLDYIEDMILAERAIVNHQQALEETLARRIERDGYDPREFEILKKFY